MWPVVLLGGGGALLLWYMSKSATSSPTANFDIESNELLSRAVHALKTDRIDVIENVASLLHADAEKRRRRSIMAEVLIVTAGLLKSGTRIPAQSGSSKAATLAAGRLAAIELPADLRSRYAAAFAKQGMSNLARLIAG